MDFKYDQDYFSSSSAKIGGNEKIRKPQLQAYSEIYNYFNGNYENRNALVVLPTGVGKTGVMALAPFHLCKKRTLIITPGTAIKDTVLESLSSDNPKNFWYKANVFESGDKLPVVIEYSGKDTVDSILQVANIVVLNVHKLQDRLASSLLKKVDDDFFDLIIIDEAHHSTADTWVNCVEYFKNAKVLKLTGTPFRTDGEPINAKLIYKYPLSRAMYNSYVKSLQNIIYIPDDLKLTIDNNEKEYSVEEIFELGLRDQDWVTRSVAYSKECSMKIVNKSIETLNKKLEGNKIPHKIIAIACSIKHANEIAQLYEERGIKSVVVHSDLSETERKQAFSDIDNHRVQAVVNVAMLGEGYDHEFLSVAAIFRPFRAELPYVQFIGRILRIINNGTAKDNIGQIISHKHLYLDELWEKYKKEINESEIIKSLRSCDKELNATFNEPNEDHNLDSKGNNIIDLGQVKESQDYTFESQDYLTTDLIRRSQQDEKEMQKQVNDLCKILKVNEPTARSIIMQTQKTSNTLNRPDLLYKQKKIDLDDIIREEIVPNLINKYNIDKNGKELEKCQLFKKKYWYIPNRIPKNDAMLAVYFNTRLKDKIGKPRKSWTTEEYDIAFEYLTELKELVEGTINKHYN